MILIVAFIGGYPLKYIGFISGLGIIFLTFFILVAKAFPDAMPNRVKTWESRIESFWEPSEKNDNYQVEKAKIAIATGGAFEKGPGRVIKRTFCHNRHLTLSMQLL